MVRLLYDFFRRVRRLSVVGVLEMVIDALKVLFN